jgi:hypothetical protein
MNYRRITKQDYPKILELDKKVYPTRNPVTTNILDQWFLKNPEFGMIFENNGVFIAIPLNKNGWNKLISGNLSESDLDSKTIFNNSRDKEIGIHIYHIEKSTENKFHEECLKALSNIVDDLRTNNPSLKIIGLSAYCVTQAGIRLFANKLNFSEKQFISNEYILEKDNELIVFKPNTQQELKNKIKEGYKQINRCKMLVSYPDEKIKVWIILNSENSQ